MSDEAIHTNRILRFAQDDVDSKSLRDLNHISLPRFIHKRQYHDTAKQ